MLVFMEYVCMYVRPKLTFVSFFLCFFFLNLPLNGNHNNIFISNSILFLAGCRAEAGASAHFQGEGNKAFQGEITLIREAI